MGLTSRSLSREQDEQPLKIPEKSALMLQPFIWHLLSVPLNKPMKHGLGLSLPQEEETGSERIQWPKATGQSVPGRGMVALVELGILKRSGAPGAGAYGQSWEGE